MSLRSMAQLKSSLRGIFFFNLVKINRGLFKNFYFAYVMFKDATQGMVAA